MRSVLVSAGHLNKTHSRCDSMAPHLRAVIVLLGFAVGILLAFSPGVSVRAAMAEVDLNFLAKQNGEHGWAHSR